MKKVLAMTLMAVLLVTATLSVSAATTTLGALTETAQAEVSVNFTDKDGNVLTPETVYSVEVNFEDLVFNFKADTVTGAEGAVWDPTTHTYNVGNAEGDDVSFTAPAAITNAIEVKNHSNAAVAVVANFANGQKTANAVNGITSTVTDADKTLASAAGAAYYGNRNTADSTSYDVSVAGNILDRNNLSFVVGAITVAISTP